MAGISSVLNIAKQAILAHQMSIQVAGHNVANVDTPGYSRQALSVSPAQAHPSGVGPIGNGVQADFIYRYYDNFSTKRIMGQSSVANNLKSQSESIRMVEASFNEAPGLALNDLLNKFWEAWQNLADNPEVLPARQSVVQQGALLANQLQTMFSEVRQAQNDIGVNLTAAISNINALTSEISNLNTQIASSESGNYNANDLRDQRDVVVKQLAEFLDINYFETNNGTYTILLPDGHALVEKDEYWEVDWEDDSLQWISKRRNDFNELIEVRTEIGSGEELGGKIGGWLEVYNMLDAQDPDSFAGSLNALSYSLIREINQQHSQGVGMTKFSGELIGTETAADTAALTSVVNASSAIQAIPANILKINDRNVGRIDGSLAVNGLAMTKAYNAVTAINQAITGVTAKLTTQVAGSAVTAMAAGNDGDVLSFDVNGVAVSYTVDTDGVGLPEDDDAATFSQNVVDAINAAITANNADPANGPDVTIEAVVGDGTNGGAMNSIVLRNTNAGDDSQIVITGIDLTTSEANLSLVNDTYTADGSHNNGQITLFSGEPFTVETGTDDTFLSHFNWDGGTISADDSANDGQFLYQFSDGGNANGLQGYEYFNELTTDGGSFDIWIYNTDGTLALAQPVTVSMERAHTLNDVAIAINDAINTAANTSTPWIQASITNGRFTLNADADHEFAFANDTSNFLQVAGMNTFFSGYNAGNITVNSQVEDDITYVAAATVSSFGEIFNGDNTNALLMTDLQRDENISFSGAPDNSFDGHYNSLVGAIGMHGQIVNRDMEFNELLSAQLKELRDSVSGVSLDEEMANLMKYQHAYSAAAKLVTMSDEMLQTLLQTV